MRAYAGVGARVGVSGKGGTWTVEGEGVEVRNEIGVADGRIMIVGVGATVRAEVIPSRISVTSPVRTTSTDYGKQAKENWQDVSAGF